MDRLQQNKSNGSNFSKKKVVNISAYSTPKTVSNSHSSDDNNDVDEFCDFQSAPPIKTAQKLENEMFEVDWSNFDKPDSFADNISSNLPHNTSKVSSNYSTDIFNLEGPSVFDKKFNSKCPKDSSKPINWMF